MESEEAPEVEVEVEAKEEAKEEMGYATKEELAEVKSMIEEIKAMLEPKKEEELSEVKAELSAELPKEVLAELSQPAVEPINTNAELQKTEVKFNISSKRPQSTMDRVMGKLNKL
jgi:L-lactate utilization protein LutC